MHDDNIAGLLAALFQVRTFITSCGHVVLWKALDLSFRFRKHEPIAVLRVLAFKLLIDSWVIFDLLALIGRACVCINTIERKARLRSRNVTRSVVGAIR